jgi:hypothetical protein
MNDVTQGGAEVQVPVLVADSLEIVHIELARNTVEVVHGKRTPM